MDRAGKGVSRCPRVLTKGRLSYIQDKDFVIRQTEIFAKWLADLRDKQTRARVLARVRRLADGNPGDYKAVGEGVLELRMMFGPGYRVYFKYENDVVIVLLTGGDKSTQFRDVEQAKRMAGWTADGTQDDNLRSG